MTKAKRKKVTKWLSDEAVKIAENGKMCEANEMTKNTED